MNYSKPTRIWSPGYLLPFIGLALLLTGSVMGWHWLVGVSWAVALILGVISTVVIFVVFTALYYVRPGDVQ